MGEKAREDAGKSVGAAGQEGLGEAPPQEGGGRSGLGVCHPLSGMAGPSAPGRQLWGRGVPAPSPRGRARCSHLNVLPSYLVGVSLQCLFHGSLKPVPLASL